MSLRTKLLMILSSVFIALLGAEYAVQSCIVIPRFIALENQRAGEDMTRVTEAIRREMHHLSLICHDWAEWDDSDRFLRGENDGFEKSNLDPNTFANAGLNLVFFVRNDRTIRASRIQDLKTSQTVAMASFPIDRWPSDHFLLRHQAGRKSIETILSTECGLLLVSSRRVLPTSGEGPSSGTLVFGRLLGHDAVQRLREQTRVDFTIWTASSLQIPQEDREGLAGLSPGQHRLIASDRQHMEGYTLLADTGGMPVLAIKARFARSISLDGKAASKFAWLSMLVGGIAMTGLLMFAIRRILVLPLRRMTAQAREIGMTGDLTRRVRVESSDEIGQLAGEFNSMVTSLGELRAQLIESSRAAGMAEIASGVLHNVGNVLNSLNVSAGVLCDTLHKSRISALNRAVGMIRDNRADLGTFLTKDEKGRLLPDFLVQVSELLSGEQQEMLKELDLLGGSVDHIKGIISAQQRFATNVNATETFELSAVLDDAIRINGPGLDRHGVEVLRNYGSCPPITADRNKLLQILVNLVANAKKAVCGAGTPGQIILDLQQTLSPEGRAMVRATVRDNGVGIQADHLPKLFTHGFTTRNDGHGFGLHFSAVVAQQLKGTLSAFSDGPGRGATFTLELPLAYSETAAS